MTCCGKSEADPNNVNTSGFNMNDTTKGKGGNLKI